MKDFNNIVASICEEVKEIAYKLANTDLTLTETENLLRETTRDWERRLMQGCYVPNATELIDYNTPVTCPICEQPMQRQRLRDKWVKTLCGDVLVSRWYFRCPQSHYCFPWDSHQELRGRYSKNVAEAMCRLSARLDFRDACDELSHHGIEVSHTTLQKTTEAWGIGINVSYWIEEQPLEQQQRWYVSCDGCHTHSPDGWHETKVGCVYRDYPQHGPKAETHAISDSMRYVATRDSAPVFGGKWFSLAVKSGIYRQGEDDAEIIAICDGAEWIWNLVDEYFPNAVQIIDYPHAQGHLWECAKRCKQAGMKWNKKGIDAILNWRCLLKNNSWERYWQISPKAA